MYERYYNIFAPFIKKKISSQQRKCVVGQNRCRCLADKFLFEIKESIWNDSDSLILIKIGCFHILAISRNYFSLFFFFVTQNLSVLRQKFTILSKSALLFIKLASNNSLIAKFTKKICFGAVVRDVMSQNRLTEFVQLLMKCEE